MTTNDRVRKTWARAIVHRETLSSRFYTLLFQKAPETKVLFKNDLQMQGAKLVSTLNFIIDHLDEPDYLLPAARDLAILHVSYDVRPEHYDLVGTCLIEALQSILGTELDDLARQAWADTYAALVSEMLPAAYPA